jgi:tetratricopeptide (TPR) repeat protein
MEKKAARTKIIIAAVAALALALVIIGIVTFSSGGTNGKLKKQLDLGQKYLTELDYESAVTAFKEGLRIDPKSEDASEGLMAAICGWNDQTYDSGAHDKAYSILEEAVDYYLTFIEDNTTNEGAYQGIVECYIRLGDLDNARFWAQKGVDKLGTDTLKELLDEVNSDSIKSLSSRIVKSTTRDADGEIVYWTLHHFVDGREVVTNYDTNDNVIDEYCPEFDEYGHVIVSYAHGGKGQLISKIVNTYNGDLMTRSDDYGLEGDSHTYTLYEYDSQNRKIFETTYDEQGEKVYYSIWEYSTNGYTRISYNRDDEISHKEVHEYGPDGKTVKKVTYYDGDGNITGTWENE